MIEWFYTFWENTLQDRDTGSLQYQEVEKALKLNYGLPETNFFAVEKLIHSHQEGSVHDYNVAFKEALRNVQLSEQITEKLSLWFYLIGLKEDVKLDVYCKRPKNYLEAMRRAINWDYIFLPDGKRSYDTVQGNNENCRRSGYKKFKGFTKNKNKQCFKCNKLGHFAKDCRSKNANFT
ncbi:ZYRO0G22132p [Zygosaccharomyces rouxii]|uniref:ZYRO0G22132p n=1 Tax=Zygosaccharomyces rouxii (strain ATCC 2623 / CBS 732 / NBRC 1130 / NCYC 568 / NRRL Y-229) TaxID=559307 RepID=C5E1M2_ZYGRC|nr:uncharacterized protein ZYRO0G22132g [Zygosaccharomyces rouxii]KAH9202996.1 hypothetical protein LQ764DRAFT_73504 [Zygosaccharomyces rouxii]CAR30006.1 ZYRO0G22132p [Zygosaccharomyces rouxii]